MGNLFVHIVVTGLLICKVTAMEDDIAELRLMLRNYCIDEIGVDVKLLEEVDNGAELMPDEKFKCYLLCTLETGGMMLDGEVDVETVLVLLPKKIKENYEKLFRGCATQRGKDDCETAFLTQLCWQDKNNKDFFLI